jgi:hypothetical protein
MSKEEGAKINMDNIISPTLEELPEEDRQAIEAQKREVEKMMLACYQKTRQGVIKKGDPTSIIHAKHEVKTDVSDSTHDFKEHIAHMVDQSVGAAMFNNSETLVKSLDHVLSSRVRALFIELQDEKD